MNNIYKGKIIAPNDIVGYVGRSGNTDESYGSHLHITKYDLQKRGGNDFFTISDISFSGPNSGSNLTKWKIIIDWKRVAELQKYRVNPINNDSVRSKNE